ncbi:MAG: 5'-methylthioadenosine/adenosylhomocysteine nucleosidase [Muribaculaceae bacterium]|nr:5'-methylthioadenosine/adenosylhomocysteine nucleosidase [Muribaculaceae bacterium]
MKIGIIAAMRKEMDLLVPLLADRTEECIGHLSFCVGRMGHHEIVVMQCGIGKVNAAIGTVTMINHYSPELIINSGVAGGADSQVSVMDIVVGSRVAYHDVWCGPESVLGAVQGLPLYYEAPAYILDILPQSPVIKRGLIVSGDQFIDTSEALQSIKQNFSDALAVDMESGAIAQVSYIYHVPFISIRVISDSPGASHDNTAQYNDFWTDAPQHTFEVVKEIISKIQ